MNYKANDTRLSHDGAAICERLDKLIELQEGLAVEVHYAMEFWHTEQLQPRAVTITGDRRGV